MYVTPAQLADGADALSELSQLYNCDGSLLALVIVQGDTSGWPADEVAVAVDALASIERFIVQADGEVDARLAQRGYPLPQSAAQFPILTVWARAIARYHLHRQRDKTSEETGRIERDYRDALRALDQVAAGKLSLGVNDPLAPTPSDPDNPESGSTRLASNERLFSRKTLGSL